MRCRILWRFYLRGRYVYAIWFLMSFRQLFAGWVGWAVGGRPSVSVPSSSILPPPSPPPPHCRRRRPPALLQSTRSAGYNLILRLSTRGDAVLSAGPHSKCNYDAQTAWVGGARPVEHQWIARRFLESPNDSLDRKFVLNGPCVCFDSVFRFGKRSSSTVMALGEA